MRYRGSLLAPFWPLATGLAFVGCFGGTPSPNIGFECVEAVQCSEGLICEYGRCRASCVLDSDCPEGDGCIKSLDHEVRVCTLVIERACSDDSCPTYLHCGSDNTCREGCERDQDCCEDPMNCTDDEDRECVGVDCQNQPCVCMERG